MPTRDDLQNHCSRRAADDASVAGRLAALESQALDPATQGAAAEVMRSAGYPMPPLWERVRALERRLQEREPTSCDPHISKEQEMNEVKLGWFDRLLIKIALAKAVARGRSVVDITGLALSLKEAFAVTRAP